VSALYIVPFGGITHKKPTLVVVYLARGAHPHDAHRWFRAVDIQSMPRTSPSLIIYEIVALGVWNELPQRIVFKRIA
jgi:hypothetical protein